MEQNEIVKKLKKEKKSGKPILAVNEIFKSIQGEGRYIGQAVVFVRFNVCHVGCTWCDTKYTWKKITNNIYLTVDQVIENVRRIGEGVNTVVLSGGEPLEQPILFLLVKKLATQGFSVQIETSGAFPITNKEKLVFLDPKVSLILSPKHLPVRISPDIVSDLKLVIDTNSTIASCMKYYDPCMPSLSLQPIEIVEDQRQTKANTDRALQLVYDLQSLMSRHTTIRLSIQIHKIIDVP